MTKIGKIAILSSGLGTLGGGIGLTFHLLNYRTIKDKLIDEGFQLSLNDAEWKTVLDAHNKIPKPSNIFEISQEENRENISWLKKKCSEVLNTREKDNTNYKLARQWCVKEESIKNILGKKGSKLRALENGQGDKDKTIWSNKIEAINSNALAGLSIELNNKEDSAKINEIKAKCKAVENKKTTDSDFNEKFELFKEWCADKNN